MALERIVAGTEADFTAKSVRYIVDRVVRFQGSRAGNFILGLSGTNGQVRRARVADFLQGLGRSEAIDWKRVCIFLVDERYGFELPEDSNSHLVRSNLLATLQERGLDFPEDRLVFPNTELSWDDCASDYEARLLKLFKEHGEAGPSLVTLGLASDMSVASIFPEWYRDSPERWAEASGKRFAVLRTETTTFEVSQRVCVNLRIIRAAETIVVYLGSGVKQVWQDVQDEFRRHRTRLAGLEPAELWEPPPEMQRQKSDPEAQAQASHSPSRRTYSELHLHHSKTIPTDTPVTRRSVGDVSHKHFRVQHSQSFQPSPRAGEVFSAPASPLGYVMKYNFVCVVQLSKDMENHHTLVVLGAAGDLARKKTLPSIFQLFLNRVLPSNIAVIGCDDPAYHSDVQNTDDWWENRLSKHLEAEGRATDLKDFRDHIEFIPTSLTSEAFSALDKRICERAQGMRDNRIFYLALPPFLFESAVKHIREDCYSEPNGFVRVIVEKPFGRDLQTAQELTRKLDAYLKEQQIFRIDHYLAKTMVMNILTMRFANRELGRLFHADNVANVRITFKEDIGVHGRAGYFDGYGIIRDIMQNHLLQLLTLVLMEAPASLQPEDVRDEKVKVLKQIRTVKVSDCAVGQYDGYQDDPDIQKINEKKGTSSKCPTFAVCVLYLDNERWSGVPLILKAGKALETRSTIVRLQFKKAPAGSLFGDQPQNELVMRVQPNEHIYYRILAKTPGLSSRPHEVRRTVLDLDLRKLEFGRAPEAYEKLIHDVMKGESHNFVRGDEVEEGWRIFDPLLRELESDAGPEPERYAAGTRGPPGADELINSVGYRRYTKTGVAGFAQDDFS